MRYECMRNALPIFALAAGLTLCSCGRPSAQAAEDSPHADAAMAKVEAEQARTDRVQARKRQATAVLYEKSLKLPEAQRGITPPPH
jgi:hypothetical protein